MDAKDFRENGHGCCCGEHDQSCVRSSEHSHGFSSGELCHIDTRMIDNDHSCSCGEHSRRNAIPAHLSGCFHGESTMYNESPTSAIDYESRYYQLKMEKEKIEGNYESELRERQAAERKFQQELEEKSFIEDKFSSLNQSIQRYDDDLNILRNENQFLKSQFDSLKNAISSRMSAESDIGHSLHLDQEMLPSSTVTLTESVDADSYKHEVAVLANENDVLRQIIEIINQQSQEKASWDERRSEKCTPDQKWQTDPDVARLQEENSKLKGRIRELERSRREQESEMEEVALDLEDQTRKTKKDISRLEEEVHSKSLLVEDLERQLYQIRMEFHEEVQKWDLKLEAEVLMKTQAHEEVNVLQGTIQNMEAERTEMVTKLEELYCSENEIIQARNDLEARFSLEISELHARIEEEIRTKVELSQEMTVLMNEFVDLRNQSKQMEVMYLNEIEALRLNNGLDIVEGAAAQNEFNANVATETCLMQQTNGCATTGQKLTQNGGRNVRDDVQSHLNQEILKRETLEKENKELLYKMKNILSNSDQRLGEQGNQGIGINVSSHTGDTNEAADGSHQLRKKIRSLENKVVELTEECESLQRSAEKGRAIERKNRDLLSELHDLSTQRDEMLRKQRTLVYEVEKSSSSLHDIMDKNRRLIDEMDSKSRRIRDMEDNFRQERNSLIRSYDKEKSSEIRDIQRKKDDLEKRLDDQVRENGKLVNKVRDLEEEIRYLKQSCGNTQLGNRTTSTNLFDSNRKAQNVNNSISKMTTNSMDFTQDTLELELLLQERQRMEDDQFKALEEQRKQMREEFEMEKQKLRKCFEDEKRSLANQFTAGSGTISHSMPGNVNVPGIHSTPSSVFVQDTCYTQTGQTSQPMPQNSSVNVVFPNAQSPVAHHNMLNNQQSSPLHANMPNPNSFQEIRDTGITPSYQTPQQPSQFHVSFQSPQSHSHQQLPYTNQYSGQGAQSIVHPQVLPGIHQDLQFNNNLVTLQQEVQRLSAEKTKMEKRLKNMERQIASTSGNVGAGNDSTIFISACEAQGSSNENEKEYTGSSTSRHPDNLQERSRSSTISMHYSSDGNIDGQLQVTMKKLVEEHRQHSDELRKQIRLQKDSFAKEKVTMQREYSALLNNVKCLKKEVHILKHERESMREKIKKERKNFEMREERSSNEVATVRKEYELKIRQQIEKSQRTVRELQRKISISEKTLKEIEMKFRDEVRQTEKKYSQDRINLEAKLRESENLARSKLECHYQAKLNSEKEKYENTLKDLRKEINCLQAQRKEIQLKITKDASDASVTTQKDTYSFVFQNKDFYKRCEKEVETRFAQEKRRLEDTILDLKKEVEELKKEKNDIKSCYREEKLEREEQFEREKKRMEERHRCDIDELKRTIDMLEGDNFKLISMQSGISVNGHQKTTKNAHTTIIQKRNTSLELKNIGLEKDIAYLKGRLSDLETRQKKLNTSNNDMPYSASERKGRFSLLNGSKAQLRRSLSSTDLRNMAGTGYQSDTYSSIRPVISRDDLGVSSSRLSSNGVTFSSGSLAAANARGDAGFLGNSYARNTDITHIPSIGILNGANGHDLGCSRDTNIAYGGGNFVGSSLGLSSGCSNGIGSGSAINGSYRRNISSGGFLLSDGATAGSYQTAGRFASGNATGIGCASYLSTNSGSSGGLLSGNRHGSESFFGKSSGMIGGCISAGVSSGSGHASSSSLSGNRSSGSVSGLMSSNAQRVGMSSGFKATSGLGPISGNSSNNMGMRSSLTSGQRTVGSGEALSGSFGGRSLGYEANSGMSCGNCSSIRGV